jgi:hypothetical protein
VLVHGLNGDPRATWTAPKNGMFWPSQLLPATLKDVPARVLVYGYNADVYAFGSGKSASKCIFSVSLYAGYNLGVGGEGICKYLRSRYRACGILVKSKGLGIVLIAM